MTRKMTEKGKDRNYNKPPEKGGLDWDAIRKARAQRLDEEIARGVDNPETREHQLPEPEQWKRVVERLNKRTVRETSASAFGGTEGQSRGGSVGGPRVDVERIKRLYLEENMKPEDIGKEMRINPATAIRWLKEEGVFDPKKFRKGWKGGTPGVPQQKDRCIRGHDLTKKGATTQQTKPDGTKNGRSCVECQRIRGRESHARKVARRNGTSTS